MPRTPAQIASHVVRNHRRLRRRLPDLHQHARFTEEPGGEHLRSHAAKRAVTFLEREVLAHADVEDQVVDRYLHGRATRGSAARLLPQHDTLREAAAGLHDYVETPAESTNVAGLLYGIAGVLGKHLEDEWQVLLPALSQLDGASCKTFVNLPAPDRPSARAYLPMPFVDTQRWMTRHLPDLGALLSDAAVTTIRRHAERLDLSVHDDLRLLIDLAPAVRSEHVGLHVGSIRPVNLGTILSPIEFELAFSPRGDAVTELEAFHVMTSRRPLPGNAPAQELTEAVFHAMVGELAGIARGRTHAPDHPIAPAG